ncbi:MAG: hypothetical protein AB7E65_09860, partial [Syntrophotalea sp.]|uniref:hypothetical protein n=1 Tax=Syntrophotalea sp. TaxID=2812029 RepID=UPI003D1379DF
FTEGRLSFTPGTVKLYKSPGRAGGFPIALKAFDLSFQFSTFNFNTAERAEMIRYAQISA